MKRLLIVFLMVLLLVGCIVENQQLRKERQQELQCIEQIESAYFNQEKLGEECEEYIVKYIKQGESIDATSLFLKGYIALDHNRIEEARDRFEQSIKLSNKFTPQFVRVYNYKFLSDISMEQGQIYKAWELTQLAFEQIDINQYDEDYNIVWDVLVPMINLEEGDRYIIQKLENILENREYELDERSKIYFYRKLVGLYVVRLNYFEAIETSIKMLELADNPDNHYYIGKTIIDIASIAKSLGANTVALDILNKIELETDDLIKKADFEIYKLLNKAENKLVLKEYEGAIQELEAIEEYQPYLPMWKQRIIRNIKYIKLAEMAALQTRSDEARSYLQQVDSDFTTGKKVSYASIEGDYIRVLALIHKIEGNYQEAKILYKKILDKKIKATDFEDYEDAFKSLLAISLDEGNTEEIQDYIVDFKSAEETIRNGSFDYYYKYVYNNYFYEKVREQNTSIKNANLISISMGALSILGICLFFILPKMIHRNRQITIRRQMRDGQYYLVYQPIVDPRKNKIIGVEALLRLKIKDKIIYPTEFIPKIEEADMMKEVSLWIIRKIKKDFFEIRWSEDIDKSFYISMNISMNEIEDVDFIHQLKKEVTNSNNDHIEICLEITENKGVMNSELVRHHIHQLIEDGFKIAIDDFGVDYSNISMLDYFDFHVLKLDKYFIDHINNSIVVKGMITTIDTIAKDLGIKIVVEGVEEEWQKEVIESMPSQQFYIQGYYYSKPIELEDLLKFNL